MPLHDNLVLYTWNIPIDSINTSITGTIVGSFNNMEDLKREAKQLLSSGKYDVLYAARPCGSIVLEAVLQEKENVTRTI